MRIPALLLALLLAGMQNSFAEPSEQQRFEKEAQIAIQALAADLKKALIAAMRAGGPVEAVTVCQSIAPSLAAQTSKKYAMEIGRTSLRVRNSDNQADSWESNVLQRFQTRMASGEAIQKLTFSEKVTVAGGQQWRMMKAIPTDKICLSCHGSKIAAPVQAVLDQHYPNDMATGYKLGDIRGAFTVKKDISP